MRYLGTSDLPLAVTVEQFKRAVHIEADELADDLLIAANLAAAVDFVETAAHRPLLARPVEFIIPAAAWRVWFFPVAPVLSLQSVAVQDEFGEWLDLDLADFQLQRGYDEPRLLSAGMDYADLRLHVTVGHDGPSPTVLRQAVILIAKEWFDAGIAVDPTAPPALSFGASSLIRQRRYLRPREFLGLS